MEKIEFYQRSAVIENYRKCLKIIENILIEIFSNFSNKCHKIF